ncbi:MAG TPA: hypothetical protein VHU40_21345 [Polyangia bacterium]|jgi:hypothetical protein|nr:hypothetical protein [Polyangia bacterium]
MTKASKRTSTAKPSPARPAPPWKSANPKPKVARKTLSARARAAARARAKKAGRRYPNLVDNMWAARGEERYARGDAGASS